MAETVTEALERSAMPKAAHDLLAVVASYRPLVARYLGHTDPNAPAVLRAEADFRGYLRQNPALIDCDPAMTAWAFLRCVRLGLDLLRDEFAIIPYDRKPLPVVMYRGYCALAYRSGMVKEIHANLVYAGEHFREDGGSSPKLVHTIDRDLHVPEKVAAAYAVATLTTGGKVWEVVTEREWERARKASPLGAKERGPWKEHRPEMILKTAVRRFAESGKLPLSPTLADAVAEDEQVVEAEPDGAE